MKKLMQAVLVVMAVVLSAPMAQSHDMSKCSADPKATACLEKLKGLVGNWEGKSMKVHGEEMTPKVTYAITSGGTAVEEKLFPGTPGEMTSIYFAEGGKICMTHYCSSGNHPEMVLKSQTDNSLTFEIKGTNGLGSADERHMHQMTLTFIDKDHISEDWVSYDKGKKADKAHFDFTRQS